MLKNKFINISKNIGKILFFLIFIYGLITAIIGLYNIFKNFLFQNDDLYQKLSQIDIGANKQYVDNLIGKPFLVRNLPEYLYNDENCEGEKTGLENFIESIYKNGKFYLQTISGENNEIIAYSITIKNKTFNPLIPLEFYHRRKEKDGSYVTEKYISGLRIGKSSFGDLMDDSPQRIGFGNLNQHTFYLEYHYFGRAGSYKDYLFGVSPYGFHYNEDLYRKMTELAFLYLDDSNNLQNNLDFFNWRARDKINTFGVIGTDEDIKERLLNYFFYYGIGPSVDIIYNLSPNNF